MKKPYRPRWTKATYAKHAKALYGLTLAEIRALDDRQGNVCAICGERPGKWLVVDHNHTTGKVRGLLCKDCNYGLGCFKDDAHRLEEAAAYVAAY